MNVLRSYYSTEDNPRQSYMSSNFLLQARTFPAEYTHKVGRKLTV